MVFFRDYLKYQYLDSVFQRVHNNYFPGGRFGLNLLVDKIMFGEIDSSSNQKINDINRNRK